MLGCTPSDPDALLLHAYERQTSTDPQNEPSYLTALSRLAEETNSDALQMRVVELKSQGKWSTEDESKAYAHLGFETGLEWEPAVLADEIVIEYFTGKMDAASSTEERAGYREDLKLVARIRDSDLLRGIVDSVPAEIKKEMTLKQAYSKFEAGPTTEDDALQAICSVYVSACLVSSLLASRRLLMRVDRHFCSF